MSFFETLGSMESIDIGLVVTGVMLFLVIIGVRVAFETALTGLIG